MENKTKVFLSVIAALVVVIIGLVVWIMTRPEPKPQVQTNIMTEEHVMNENALQNTQGVKRQDAEDIVQRIERIKEGKRNADAYAYVEEDEAEEAGGYAEVVERKIQQKDPTMPPEALKQTDKTIIVENEKETKDGVKVGVYKINTYRNWEIGMGVGRHEGDTYIPLSIQRNYDKAHSVALEAHFSVDRGEFNGAEIQYKIHF